MPTKKTRTMTAAEARRRAFAKQYVVDFNGTQAAIRAGFSPKSARSEASRMLTNHNIQTYIQEEVEARNNRTETEADRVLEEIKALAFSNIGNFIRFDETGLARVDLSELTVENAACVEMVTADIVKRDGNVSVIRVKLKLYPKLPALLALARHVGLDLAGKATLERSESWGAIFEQHKQRMQERC